MLTNQRPQGRVNQTHKWSPSDTEENYKPTQKDGSPNYSKDAFDYKFNSDGFRCDNLDEHSDLPILFMGCSYTEGQGLPLNEVWSSKLLDKIRLLPQNIDKKIPFFSLALGGTGIDTMARVLGLYCKRIKPKYIFHLVTSYYRREFCYGYFDLQDWLPNVSNPYMPTTFNIDRLYTDYHYAYYESSRSLSLINAIAGQYNIRVFALDSTACGDAKQGESFVSLYNNLTNVTRIPVDVKMLAPEVANKMLIHARDNMHWGPWWHDALVNDIWIELQKQSVNDFSDSK